MGDSRLNVNAPVVVILLVLLLVGGLAICAQGVRELGVAGEGSSREIEAGDDEGHGGSKIYLVFCQKSVCVDDETCYCCLGKNLCWETMEDCRARCAVCDPKCHPAPPRPKKRSRLLHSPAPPVADGDNRVTSRAGRGRA
ncbi:hypothetical protein ACP70R_033630 [Stipagrostis hirtigluma subsp. patula]